MSQPQTAIKRLGDSAQGGAGEAADLRGYGREGAPLGSYAVLTGVFGSAAAAVALAARRSGRRPPARVGAGDILLLGAATHKLSRLITKDWVTSFLRAPFVRIEGPSAPAEVNEQPRGEGLRLAVGELLTCPFCVAQWVAGGLTASFLFAPRATRLVATMFAATTISDFLQYAYALTQKEETLGGEG